MSLNEQEAPVRVSVLMTIYNAEPYLREAIDSLIAQTIPDWELIAIENGSMDASPAILSSYDDPRLKSVVLPTNIGRTPALRYAFEQARGEYIAVLDADDVSHPERFARQIEYLDQHPEVGLVGSWAEYINGRSDVVAGFKPPIERGELYDSLGWMNAFVHSSIMYRTRLGRHIGGYPEAYIYAQDNALILNIAKVSRVAMIGEYLCRVRVTRSNMTRSSKYRITVATEELMLLKQAARDLSLSKKAVKQNKLRQAVSQLKIGAGLLSKWHIFTGFKYILCGVVKDPSSLFKNGIVNKLLRSV
jgi:glycosyltransferase involved in cell wall biosynthesis